MANKLLLETRNQFRIYEKESLNILFIVLNILVIASFAIIPHLKIFTYTFKVNFFPPHEEINDIEVNDLSYNSLDFSLFFYLTALLVAVVFLLSKFTPRKMGLMYLLLAGKFFAMFFIDLVIFHFQLFLSLWTVFSMWAGSNSVSVEYNLYALALMVGIVLIFLLNSFLLLFTPRKCFTLYKQNNYSKPFLTWVNIFSLTAVFTFTTIRIIMEFAEILSIEIKHYSVYIINYWGTFDFMKTIPFYVLLLLIILLLRIIKEPQAEQASNELEEKQSSQKLHALQEQTESAKKVRMARIVKHQNKIIIGILILIWVVWLCFVSSMSLTDRMVNHSINWIHGYYISSSQYSLNEFYLLFFVTFAQIPFIALLIGFTMIKVYKTFIAPKMNKFAFISKLKQKIATLKAPKLLKFVSATQIVFLLCVAIIPISISNYYQAFPYFIPSTDPSGTFGLNAYIERNITITHSEIYANGSFTLNFTMSTHYHNLFENITLNEIFMDQEFIYAGFAINSLLIDSNNNKTLDEIVLFQNLTRFSGPSHINFNYSFYENSVVVLYSADGFYSLSGITNSTFIQDTMIGIALGKANCNYAPTNAYLLSNTYYVEIRDS